MTTAQVFTNLAYILACVSTITGIKMLGMFRQKKPSDTAKEESK